MVGISKAHLQDGISGALAGDAAGASFVGIEIRDVEDPA
jgi:hypothetical protein